MTKGRDGVIRSTCFRVVDHDHCGETGEGLGHGKGLGSLISSVSVQPRTKGVEYGLCPLPSVLTNTLKIIYKFLTDYLYRISVLRIFKTYDRREAQILLVKSSGVTTKVMAFEFNELGLFYCSLIVFIKL